MSESAGSTGAWAPLRDARFRASWLAFLGAQIAIWAQTVGAVDVITAESESAALVAFIQTAISLPGVVLALLSGAVADVVDRRRLLVVASLFMAVSMGALAAMTAADLATPVVVLVLTAALGTGLAVFLPAFSAMVPDLVPRSLLAPAVAVGNVSVNIARAVGPALAGVLLAVVGAEGLFFVLAAALLAVVATLAVHGVPSVTPERQERLSHAVRAGARYVRFSGPLRNVVVRTGLFVVFGAAMWAILPLIAVRRLGLEASGFGLLLAAVGVGAIGGATLLPSFTARLTVDRVVAVGSAVLAAVLAALTVVKHPAVAAAVLVVAGVAWIAVLTSILTAAQLVSPAWVRGRALAIWLLAYQGGLALGSFAWGLVAERSLSAALLVPAGALLVTMLAGRRLELPDAAVAEPEPLRLWDDPILGTHIEDSAGPVLVTVEYDVDEDDAAAFVSAMKELAAVRRRDGAVRWHLFYDVAEPCRFVETFEVTTWGEHLLQHERGTQVDLPLEQRAVALTVSFTVRHLVSAVRRP